MSEPAITHTPAQVSAPAWHQALAGAGVWLVAHLWLEPEWALSVLWLGALVHVPLALGLVSRGDAAARRVVWSRLTLLAAVTLPLAFAVEVGWIALPWLVFT